MTRLVGALMTRFSGSALLCTSLEAVRPYPFACTCASSNIDIYEMCTNDMNTCMHIEVSICICQVVSLNLASFWRSFTRDRI